MTDAIQPVPATINDAFMAFDALSARLERLEILMSSNNDDLGAAIHHRPEAGEYRAWCVFTLAEETLLGIHRDLNALHNHMIKLGAF